MEELAVDKNWHSVNATVLWGTTLSSGLHNVEPVITDRGLSFIPDMVEWVRYYFLELTASGASVQDSYTMVYAWNEESLCTTSWDLRVAEIPDWIPTPPDGWENGPGKLAEMPLAVVT